MFFGFTNARVIVDYYNLTAGTSERDDGGHFAFPFGGAALSRSNWGYRGRKSLLNAVDS